MTDWISLNDALTAVTPEGGRLVAGMEVLVARCRAGLMRCRAGRRCEDGAEAKVDVDVPSSDWKAALFWLDPEPALRANVLPINSKLLLADLHFDRAGVEAVAIRPLAAAPEEVSVAGAPSHVEVKGALREYIEAGVGKVGAIAALDVHFKGRPLPSRDGYLRPWADEMLRAHGRDPSKPGPKRLKH